MQANLFLLATCYHRSNQSYRAYHLLKGLAGEQSRYLYALCAMQLGKLTEAETVLLPDNDATQVGHAGGLLGQLGRCCGPWGGAPWARLATIGPCQCWRTAAGPPNLHFYALAP
jgi:hypothetical protein